MRQYFWKWKDTWSLESTRSPNRSLPSQSLCCHYSFCLVVPHLVSYFNLLHIPRLNAPLSRTFNSTLVGINVLSLSRQISCVNIYCASSVAMYLFGCEKFLTNMYSVWCMFQLKYTSTIFNQSDGGVNSTLVWKL